jgi:hypothetical protein
VILRRRKSSPVFARVEERRRAVADVVGDPAATERHGAQNPGVRQRRTVDRLRLPATFGDKLRARRVGGSRASRWRV